MNYIQPNSTIKLLSGVKLKNDYLHSKYNTSAEEQYNSFNAYTYKELNDLSYTRYSANVITVEISMSEALKCNYIMFKNTDYENKWFYAFVTKIEYVNNNNVKMYYEIDEIQTWYFESHYNQCYVEREHTATDGLFEHLIPEDMPAGDYIINSSEFTEDIAKDWLIILAYSDTGSSGVNTGTKRANLYSGLSLYSQTFDDEGIEAMNNKIGSLVEDNKADSIVAIYMTPKVFTPISGSDSVDAIQLSISPNTTSLDGYVPKNKKLFNYPYNFLDVSNGQSSHSEFRYEYVTDYGAGSLIFQVYCDGLPSAKALLRPVNYAGTTTGNWDKTLTSPTFPLCSWSTDYYQAWMAQNSLSTSADIAGSLLGGVAGTGMFAVGLATANPVLTATGAFSATSALTSATVNVTKSINSVNVAKTHGDNFNGEPSGNVLAGLRRIGFWFFKKSINHDLAESYDKYLTMYGYKVNTVKIPNPANRPSYTFIKTIGCNITGECPNEALNVMNNAHDHGITFWRNLAEIGNYDVNNQV